MFSAAFCDVFARSQAEGCVRVFEENTLWNIAIGLVAEQFEGLAVFAVEAVKEGGQEAELFALNIGMAI